jgi:predicted regulator of Ras-like GTPase activity (Roadblock/LC7/MglB family)
MQLVEVEKRTCTLRVRTEDEIGDVLFNKGVLWDSRVGPLQGVEAVYKVLGFMPQPEVEVLEGCRAEARTIDVSITQLLLEALKRRDESNWQGESSQTLRTRSTYPPDTKSEPPSRTTSGLLPRVVRPPQPSSGPPQILRAEQEARQNEGVPSMKIASLPEILQAFRVDVPGFVSTDIVEVESGLSISGGSIDPSFDASVAAASYSEVVKSNSRALELLSMDPASTEDILITTKTTYFLIRTLGSSHYHLLAISRQGNLGLARVIMKRYEAQFLQAIA